MSTRSSSSESMWFPQRREQQLSRLIPAILFTVQQQVSRQTDVAIIL